MSSEPTTYDAYLELRDDGSCRAHLLDLPGCYSIGTGQDAALTALVAAIPPYYDWLRQHDDYTPQVHGPFAVVPREVQRASLINGRLTSVFFSPDAEPVTAEDLDWLVSLLDWAYADFFTVVSSLPPAALETLFAAGNPPRDSHPYAHLHPAAYIAQEQLWLLSRIEPQPRVPQLAQLPGTSLDKLRQVWQASLHRLRATSDDERERILEQSGERWSLRKVLHCSILLVRIQTDTLT